MSCLNNEIANENDHILYIIMLRHNDCVKYNSVVVRYNLAVMCIPWIAVN